MKLSIVPYRNGFTIEKRNWLTREKLPGEWYKTEVVAPIWFETKEKAQQYIRENFPDAEITN